MCRRSWRRGCQVWVRRLDTPVCSFISRTDGLEGPGLMSCGPSLPSPEKEVGPPWILLLGATYRPLRQRCGSGPSGHTFEATSQRAMWDELVRSLHHQTCTHPASSLGGCRETDSSALIVPLPLTSDRHTA